MEERQSLLQKIRKDVDDVRVIMQDNLTRAKKRGENVDELDQRADKLLESSKIFARTMRRPEENQHRNNVSWKVTCCGMFCVALIIIIITIVITGTQKHWF